MLNSEIVDNKASFEFLVPETIIVSFSNNKKHNYFYNIPSVEYKFMYI